MDAKTEALLLKTRKQATAQFNVKEWSLVLPELGFKFDTIKEGRSVVGVIITSPKLDQLKITKENGYKRVTFYDLVRWTKSVGFDLVELASNALGMETPEKEAKLKALYVRDLTNTGTCPVCGDNFKREANGGLHHHGYRRPGDGQLYGSCFGVGYQPWELEPTGAVEFVKLVLEPKLERLSDYLRRLEAGEVTSFTVEKERTYVERRNKVPVVWIELTRESDEYRFERKLESEISTTTRSIKMVTSSLEMFRKAIAEWKEDILPEFKYAGKFKKV